MYLNIISIIRTFWYAFLNNLDAQSDSDKNFVKKRRSTRTILILSML